MKLHNTLTRQVENVKPLHDKVIKLYVCGLTVYSHPHIGNWVAYIYWDVLVRTLRASGFKVKHVQNITDVGHLTSDEDAGEDKMSVAALREGKTAWDVAEKYIKIADKEGYELLGLTRPDHLPRATDYISQQIAFVQDLENKGYTYTLPDGVYFDTSRLKDYGQLARLDIKGLQFGARVADTGKKNPTDFAVWKLSSPDEKRDMEWDSPWGKGFPGWHLECSVMARELLGDQIDIHTGGIDHIPVHHTNEIAQTESVTGKQFAQLWMHANHMKVNGTKMAKSLGNIYTLQDLQDKGFDLQAFKLMVLSKHYRTEGNFTWEILEAAQSRLNRWQATADLRWQLKSEAHGLEPGDILEKLQDDLDTPGVLAMIDEYFDKAENRLAAPSQDVLKAIGDLLGINLLQDDVSQKVKDLMAKRQQARAERDWAKSDELRDQLAQERILVRDTEQGAIWSRAKV